ncbi:hypothetical protein NTGBS_150013 [Candidatus Nitrotoga sp. BS]|uniref:hypothetical protein n=1 Tax=Candidatus Nitrotoga sp. BS TaxID=2890408 RepID=UPI001EF3A71D|nr:hypothetical protein [Candidatus Nitrotoga sp. BS]CAH1192282.1 hypothetical protein NTGBS_150013 [Candidatus Nitrotoga sp. BS]
MALLSAGRIEQKEADKIRAVSMRQIKRILRRYRTFGLPVLISKQRGRVSNRRMNETIRTAVIKMVGEHYHDFGSTLANVRVAKANTNRCTADINRRKPAAGHP